MALSHRGYSPSKRHIGCIFGAFISLTVALYSSVNADSADTPASQEATPAGTNVAEKLLDFFPRDTHPDLFYDPAKNKEREIAPPTRGLRLFGIRKALRVLYYNATLETWAEDQYKFYDYVRATRFYFIGILPPGTPPPDDLRSASMKVEHLLTAYMDLVDDKDFTDKDRMEIIVNPKGLIPHFDKVLQECIPAFEVYEERRRERPPPSAKELIDELIRRQAEHQEQHKDDPEPEDVKLLKKTIQETKDKKEASDEL